MRKLIITIAFLLLAPFAFAHDNDGRCVHSTTIASTNPSVIEYTNQSRISFYFTINNTDQYCYSRGYDVKVDKPAGWEAFAQSSIVISPQGYSTISVALVPPSNLADGIYDIPIRVVHYEGGVNTSVQIVKGVSAPIEESPQDDIIEEPVIEMPPQDLNQSETDETSEIVQPKSGFWERVKSFFRNIFS